MSASTIVTKRCCSAKRRSLAIMARLLVFEKHRAVGHDAVTRFESGEHGQDIAAALPDSDLGLLEAAGSLLDEHYVVPVTLDHCSNRHDGAELHGFGMTNAAEHLGPKAPLRVIELGPHLDG